MRNRNKAVLAMGILVTVLMSVTGCGSSNDSMNGGANKPSTESSINQSNRVVFNDDMFKGYNLIEVDGGDLSGHREPHAVVDIGFGDREYYAFTNEHGQLVKVVAEEIILQDDKNEPVLATGRYYRDEAKVPGVESKVLDEGHVIADSLGGVSNAYNITPQNSTLNRHGDQAYMEDAIRKAGGCTDFTALITYPDTKTQIPSQYSYTYTIKGKVVSDSFDNVNPDEVNADLNDQSTSNSSGNSDTDVAGTHVGVVISVLNKDAEYIVIQNKNDKAINLKGWGIVSVAGNQRFTFPEITLGADESIKVGDLDRNTDVDLHWMEGSGVWNNSKSDPAELYNSKGELIYRFED